MMFTSIEALVITVSVAVIAAVELIQFIRSL